MLTRISVIFLLGILISGCSASKAWKYGPESSTNNAPLINRSLAVPPFNDQRKNENSNKLGMYLIPLMPYGWQELNTPEGTNPHVASGLWQWRPNEDIAKAAAEEIDSASLFKESFFSNRANDGDLVLAGTIKSTKYDGKLITYGLSVEGPLLWLFLPASSVSNELAVSFKLEDRKNHVTLWEKDYREQIKKTSWIYSIQSDFDYSDLLKKIMLKAVNDMKAAIPGIRDKLSQRNESSAPLK